MLRRFILAFVAILVALVIVVSFQPADFVIERSISIKSSPNSAFEQVNNFHHWQHWSPWAKIDPDMKAVYSGAETGEGAIYSWVGNNEVGEGKMAIVKSVPPSLIKIKLEFLRPMEATNECTFKFEPNGEDTLITWTMTGSNGFIAKAFSLFFNVDDMVGKDFDKGLNQLKSRLENPKV